MLENLANDKRVLFWLIFHVLLGIGSVYTNILVIGWYYFITLTLLYAVLTFSARKSAMMIALFLIYTGGFELLGRMSKCSPYIPYEVGKYSFLMFSLLGVLLSFKISSRSVLGIVVMLLILPAFFIDISGKVVFLDIVFNIIGLINVALGIVFFSSLNISFSGLIKCLRLLMFPIISILLFAYIRTPDLSEIEFDLMSSTLATGGFGSNQVSTVFGLGFMIMTIAWISNIKLFKYRWLDGVLSLVFLIQGLLTFSRGGMVGGLIGIIIYIFYVNRIERHERVMLKIPNIKMMVLPAIIVIIAGFIWVDRITLGTLAMRYQGETFATSKGLRVKDVYTVTSGRAGIVESDIKLWRENILLGTGIGASRYEREGYEGIAPHTELTRILAEHGLLGIVIIILIGYIVSLIVRRRLPNYIKGYVMALLVLSILTTFHSATRTFVTPLIFSICCMSISAAYKQNQIQPNNQTR